MSDSESSDEPVVKKSKKPKAGATDKGKSGHGKKQRLEDPDTSDEEIIDKTPIKKAKASSYEKNADGEEMMPLGKMRFVTVRSFKGKALVDIREYYTDKGDGSTKPGKKGISLSAEQYQDFKRLIPEIDKKLGEV